jgi:hypothetical protein
MDEEKTPTPLKRNLRRCVLCGQAAAILSVLLMMRKRRAHKHEKHHKHRFPLPGH